MNEAQVRTLDQMREVLADTQSLEMRPVADEAGWVFRPNVTADSGTT